MRSGCTSDGWVHPAGAPETLGEISVQGPGMSIGQCEHNACMTQLVPTRGFNLKDSWQRRWGSGPGGQVQHRHQELKLWGLAEPTQAFRSLPSAELQSAPQQGSIGRKSGQKGAQKYSSYENKNEECRTRACN